MHVARKSSVEAPRITHKVIHPGDLFLDEDPLLVRREAGFSWVTTGDGVVNLKEVELGAWLWLSIESCSGVGSADGSVVGRPDG